jgi:hypothetical protein
MTEPQSFRELALDVWRAQLGKPYRWGGDDPLAGFDCSGLVIEGLRAAGILPREGDWSADALCNSVFKDYPRLNVPQGFPAGALLFWNRGTPAKIGHVEIVWSVIGGKVFTLGASGGGSADVDVAHAIADNAYVKIRPAVTSWAVCLDPFSR